MVKPVETVQRVALTDAVYQRVLQMIMDGSAAPGEPLRLIPLSQQLGVSQTPVREALGRLVGEGLVQRQSMRGFAVAEPLTAAEVDQLMRTRLLLEPEIAVEAAGVDGLDEALLDNIAKSRAVEVGMGFEGYKDYLELSAAFHELLATACGNRFMREALDALPIHVQRFRLFGDDGVTDVDVSLDEHDAIRAAIASRDAAAIRAAMATHITGVHDRSATPAAF